MAKWTLRIVAFLSVWAVLSTLHLLASSSTTTLGPFRANVSPTYDSHIVIDGGALLPAFRIPGQSPVIGLKVKLEDIEEGTLGQAVTTAAIVGSNPDGEIAKLKSVLWRMALVSLLFGLCGAGVFLVLLVQVKPHRGLTTHLRQSGASRKRLGLTTLTLIVLTAPLPLLALEANKEQSLQWEPVRSVFPQVPIGPQWEGVEVEASPLTGEVKSLVDGAVQSYRDSLSFYGELETEAESLVGLRQPLENQQTVLVLTDRHDNTPMDAVAKAVGDEVGARIVFVLGDDTASGGKWEEFSINSLATTFDSYDAIVAVNGNHDAGAYVSEAMRSRGIDVLDGEVLDINGIRVAGLPDPRASEFGRGYVSEARTVDEVDEQLTALACRERALGSPVTVLTHAPSTTERLVETGCANLVLTGHLHRQVGPEIVDGLLGRTATLTTGSTGGAAYAFALGSKLRREAQVSLITYEAGQPVGAQVVTFSPGGEISVSAYTDFTLD